MTREEFTTIALDRNLHSALKEIATFKKVGRYDILIEELLCEKAKEDDQIKFSLERYGIKCTLTEDKDW